MTGVSPGPSGGQGSKPLSLEEMKKLFFGFLIQQGYAIPEEAKALFGDGNRNRGSSPSPSTCSSKRSSSALSSDESSDQSDDTIKGSDVESDSSFISVTRRKSRKAARRSSKTDTDETMDTEPVNHKAATAAPTPVASKAAPNNKSSAPVKTTVESSNSGKKTGSTPVAPPKPKLPPPIILRDKSQWSKVSSECSKQHINFTKAQNTSSGIKITTSALDDFRKLNSFLIKNKIPFHTFALEEERKIKAVVKGIPEEIPLEDVLTDLKNQGYPVLAVHKMHRRNGSPIMGMVLAILENSQAAKEIYRNLTNVCSLSDVRAEAPYGRGMPGQCHRCQLYGHAAANCHAQPRCVKCNVPYLTKECGRTKESDGKPTCCNCGQGHTANYGGCPAAPKPKPIYMKSNKTYRTDRQVPLLDKDFPQLSNKATGRDDFRPAPVPTVNAWHRAPQKKDPQPVAESARRTTHLPAAPRHTGAVASALGEDISTIMSILQIARSAEVTDLAAKFRKAKHGIDRLRLILENQELISRLENL